MLLHVIYIYIVIICKKTASACWSSPCGTQSPHLEVHEIQGFFIIIRLHGSTRGISWALRKSWTWWLVKTYLPMIHWWLLGTWWLVDIGWLVTSAYQSLLIPGKCKSNLTVGDVPPKSPTTDLSFHKVSMPQGDLLSRKLIKKTSSKPCWRRSAARTAALLNARRRLMDMLELCELFLEKLPARSSATSTWDPWWSGKR